MGMFTALTNMGFTTRMVIALRDFARSLVEDGGVESEYLTDIEPGVAGAGKALVTGLEGEANELDIIGLETVAANNYQAGGPSSEGGVGGSFTFYPPTAARGNTRLQMENNAGDTGNILQFLAQAGVREFDIPDPGAAVAAFVLTEGAQTLNGAKTFSGNVAMNGAANTLGNASTDLFTATGRIIHRSVTDAGPMTATPGTQGEVVFNTSDSKFYGCTVTHGTAATWVAFH